MILAFHTAGATTELKVLDDRGHTIKQETWASGRRLADQLLGKILELLTAAQLTQSDLSGIIIFSGPGSFTSLRIGHSVANALADSLNIPVAGVSGEDWLEQGLQALKSAQPGRPALPAYGAEAHITQPKP